MKHEIDITGKVCPFTLLITKKKIEQIDSGDELEVLCDHPPAATETIPHEVKSNGHSIDVEKVSEGLWKLKIIKK